MSGYISGISPSLRDLVVPVVDIFADGTDFNDGSSTYIDLSATPGSENSVTIAFDGVYQNHDTFSISGVRVTFDAAIPTGTAKIEARYAQENRNYTTIADDAVTLAKMASGTDGNLLTYDASGNPAHVATGSDGQVLTSAGAGAPPAFETLSAGTVLQRVKVFSSAAVTLSGNIPVDATIPQITEGTELYTLAITPKSNDSVLYFHGIIAATADSGSVDLVMPMFVDSTANAIFTSYNYLVAVNYRVQSTIYGTVANSSTSARTYRLRVGTASSTDLEINQMNAAGGKFGGTWGSGFDITEVAN